MGRSTFWDRGARAAAVVWAVAGGWAWASGCATSPAAHDHRAEGGATAAGGRLPPGPWALDSATVAAKCGEGAGLLLTQVLRERGYAVVGQGSPTRVAVECAWSQADVVVWEIDTARAQGRCVAEGVRELRATLVVTHGPYAGQAPADLARTEFQGRARLEPEPPHRGCVVGRETDASLLARGIRALADRIPEGAQTGPLLVAPAPGSGDVVVGVAGPPRASTTQAPPARTIYPVEFGDRPAPPEATSGGGVVAVGGGAVARHEKEVPEVGAAGAATAPRMGKTLAPGGLLTRLALGVELGGAACTDFCSELFAGGPGGGVRVLFHAHDLLALEGGWRRFRMDPRDGRRVPDGTETVLTGYDFGARMYVGRPGRVRVHGGVGVSATTLGDEWARADQTAGTQFTGVGTRLRAGVEAPLRDWLALGMGGAYDRMGWARVCERDGPCEDVDRFHAITGSDVWSAGLEAVVAWP